MGTHFYLGILLHILHVLREWVGKIKIRQIINAVQNPVVFTISVACQSDQSTNVTGHNSMQ